MVVAIAQFWCIQFVGQGHFPLLYFVSNLVLQLPEECVCNGWNCVPGGLCHTVRWVAIHQQFRKLANYTCYM
jgi:hypothetical protein